MMIEKKKVKSSSLLLILVGLAIGLIFTSCLVLAADRGDKAGPEDATFFALTRVRVRPPDEPLKVNVQILDCDGNSLRETQVSFEPPAPPTQQIRDLAIELAAPDISPQPLIWLVCEPSCKRLFCAITANDGRSPGMCPQLSCRDFVPPKIEDQSVNDMSLLGSHRIVDFSAEEQRVVGNPIIE